MSDSPTPSSPAETTQPAASPKLTPHWRPTPAQEASFKAARDRILARAAKAATLKSVVAPVVGQVERDAAAAKAERDAKERADRAEETRRWGLWRRSGVQKRHQEMADAGYEWTGEQVAAAPKLQRACEDGGISFLIGAPGNGKTQVAVETIRWGARHRGWDARWSKFADLLDEIRHEVYEESESGRSLLMRLRSIRLMVIDEIDKRRWTPDEQLWLSRLLDHRYGEKHPTILIANLTREQLEGRIDQPAHERAVDLPSLDRAWQGGTVVEFTGPSLRRVIVSEGRTQTLAHPASPVSAEKPKETTNGKA